MKDFSQPLFFAQSLAKTTKVTERGKIQLIETTAQDKELAKIYVDQDLLVNYSNLPSCASLWFFTSFARNAVIFTDEFCPNQ